jgi:glycerol-3-phosphate dehydrogenase
MGPCQGELCAYRAAGLMHEYGKATGPQACGMLRQFIEERFKGTRPVLWGDALREAEFTYWIYEGLFGLGQWTADEPETQGARHEI